MRPKSDAPSKSRPPNGSLTLCGLGISRPQDATLAAIEALKRADVVFYLHGDGPALLPFFKAFCPSVTLYAREHARLDPHEKLKRLCADVCARLARGKRVVYATYGHPLIFSDAFHVMNACRERGFACSVIAGISAVDAILAVLSSEAKALARGQVSCHAEDVVVRPQILPTGLAAVLLGVDSLAARGLYDRFCARLESHYGATHPIFGVKCGDTAGDGTVWRGIVRDARRWKVPPMMSFVLPAQ